MKIYKFETIVEYFGGPSAMARTFETTTQALWLWRKFGIPPNRRWEIEVRSNREFRHDQVPIRRVDKANAPITRSARTTRASGC